MSEFVWRFAKRADGNDLFTLLGDTDVAFDGYPTDPAAWFDWLASLDWIEAGNEPLTGADPHGQWWANETRAFLMPSPRALPGARDATISRAEAYLAMTEYLWRFANGPSGNQIAEVVATLREHIDHPEDGALWSEWEESVRWVLAGNAPQSGPSHR
ncbi:MAG: hypothetical protein ACQEW8_07175 [Actinomycetota bacterium]